jgi:hypothetical protein
VYPHDAKYEYTNNNSRGGTSFVDAHDSTTFATELPRAVVQAPLPQVPLVRPVQLVPPNDFKYGDNGNSSSSSSSIGNGSGGQAATPVGHMRAIESPTIDGGGGGGGGSGGGGGGGAGNLSPLTLPANASPRSNSPAAMNNDNINNNNNNNINNRRPLVVVVRKRPAT